MSSAIISCQSLTSIAWQPYTACTFQDELAVFSCPLSISKATASVWRSLLQPDELARLHRYRRLEDQHRFGCTRGLLRRLLSQYTQQLPQQIQFKLGNHQKPELTGNTGWQFNVSHAGQWLLIAIGRSSVGVDVEQLNPTFPIQDIITSAFSQTEQHVIEASADAHALFYQFWTRKEALVKATGQGIGVTLSDIPCLNGEHQQAESLIGASGHWLVQSFSLDAQHPATVAHHITATLPVFYSLTDSFFSQEA